MTLSNVGIVTMPEELQKYIKLFSVFASTHCIQTCMCSYLDNMTVSFTSHLVDTEIQKNFFKSLTDSEINVLINDNAVEDNGYEEVL